MPSDHRLKRVLQVLALLALVVVAIGLAPPGCELTDKERPAPDGPPAPVLRPIDYFGQPWDSEGRADWRVAEFLAVMSQSSYETAAKVEADVRAIGFARVESIVRGSMVAYVASAENAVVVAFRGTDDAGDWLTNLNCVARATPHGDIHEGFAAAYEMLRPEVLTAVRRDMPRHLWITGHSLGGALAVVCAYDLIEKERLTPNGLITFGQPMVASEPLARHLDTVLLGRFVHVVNEGDIVPRVPPCFVHCGSLVWFTDGGVRRSKPKRSVYGAADDKAPSAAGKGEIEAVSVPEFETIKADLRRRQAAPRGRPDDTPIYEGNAPFLRDHPVHLYVEKVRSLFRRFSQTADEQPNRQ